MSSINIREEQLPCMSNDGGREILAVNGSDGSSQVKREACVANFIGLDFCWVCGRDQLVRVFQSQYDLTQYSEQDPELASYTGQRFWLNRCQVCGFTQPDTLPTLLNYFDRLYDQRWSEEWIEREFASTYKDNIFQAVLDELDIRVPSMPRRFLDIGAHVGRFIHLAQQAGWQAEGIELNPRTSAYASRRTGRPVHQVNAHQLASEGRKYEAITLIDVLEHIPDPVNLLNNINGLLELNGWLCVKVPCGRNQILKEKMRSHFRKNYRMTVADNLVHINHFSPASLRLALKKAGFSQITITLGAPELTPVEKSLTFSKAVWSNRFRAFVYRLGKILPGGVYSPLALNLQAYAQK